MRDRYITIMPLQYNLTDVVTKKYLYSGIGDWGLEIGDRGLVLDTSMLNIKY